MTTGKVRSVLHPVSTSGASGASLTTAAGTGLPQLVGAVRQFRADRYSQLKRWQQGFSDCSSFVGKGLKALGITPPGASTTVDYLAWSALRKIPESALQAGDLVVNTAHMIVATGPGTGIGQQNGRRNVQEGTIADLMAGTGTYVCLRYTGGAKAAAGGPTMQPLAV